MEEKERHHAQHQKNDIDTNNIKSERNIEDTHTITNVADILEVPDKPRINPEVFKIGKPFYCSSCDLKFSSQNEYENHLLKHASKSLSKENEKFVCDVCNEEFNKNCDLGIHSRVHTGEKPFKCDQCRKHFQQAHDLTQHLKTHITYKPFICEICEKTFRRKDILTRHILVHSQQKPFECWICAKRFIRKVQLIGHVEHKHRDEGIQKVEFPDYVNVKDEQFESSE